jgi:hypothetical protein
MFGLCAGVGAWKFAATAPNAGARAVAETTCRAVGVAVKRSVAAIKSSAVRVVSVLRVVNIFLIISAFDYFDF